ncbi:polysaccharide deacetylase [Clostridium zeae]|uniref:Polysaccharide deacetylase n=1 Tax=Clostridium zeae TaxID=2759022 RepID=A0ABQ1EE41_9CLOT|nr:polysaccharide deacetylase family protein [Clostridium zeae]GFZ33024.1 polysaccharide deacetylase [Clostridium zeae]
MRKKKSKKRRRIIRVMRSIVYLSIIITVGLLIAYKNMPKDVPKIEKVQVGSKVKMDNINSKKQLSDDSNKNTSNEINKVESSNKINIGNDGFDAGKVQDLLVKNTKIQDGKKIAFLTFDDGPSTTVTPKILKILKDNNVKATFFIVGKQLEESSKAKNILLDTYNQGHAIANHTYSHNYSKLYPHGTADITTYMEEVEKTNNLLKSVIGENFSTRVIRFPGGHASWKGTEGLDKILEEKSYKFIDWNALIGDAEGGNKTKEQLLARYHQTFTVQDKVVLLMHDTYGKESTADALQDIITDLKNKGYEFKTLK